MKKLFGLLALAIVAIAFAACGGNSNTPEGVAEKYMKCYQKGDWKGMVEQMNVSEEEKGQILQVFEAKGDAALKESGGIKSYKIEESEVAEDGQSAKVKFSVVYGNGKEDTEKVRLVLVDGKWKVKM